jgi:hypothetical protein
VQRKIGLFYRRTFEKIPIPSSDKVSSVSIGTNSTNFVHKCESPALLTCNPSNLGTYRAGSSLSPFCFSSVENFHYKFPHGLVHLAWCTYIPNVGN